MSSSKTKTLLIYKYLSQYSDENNPLSAADLIEMLDKDGISCERKSIYADIKTLNSIGFDVITSMSNKRGFFLASRTFELAQVRLLIDAVTSAGFITPDKTRDLVNKLEGLVSVNEAKELVSQVYIDANSKCDNEEIYYIIDALHDAIIERRKVKFTYKRRNIDKENRKSYTLKSFRVSPYALIWKGDHYYLVCNNEKYDNLMNLRLDRMRKIEQLDEPARDISEFSEYADAIDVADYTNKMFNMFSGDTGEVKLRCHLDLREEIMDRFGAKIPLVAVDTEHFETTINAAVSDGLISWIMNFGDKLKVVEPESLAQAVKERALKIAELY